MSGSCINRKINFLTCHIKDCLGVLSGDRLESPGCLNHPAWMSWEQVSPFPLGTSPLPMACLQAGHRLGGSFWQISGPIASWLAFLAFPFSLVAQLVKNLPGTRETWGGSLGWEDPLEKKGKATHSSILAWRFPWTVQSMGSQGVWRHWATFTSLVDFTSRQIVDFCGPLGCSEVAKTWLTAMDLRFTWALACLLSRWVLFFPPQPDLDC